MSHGCTGETMGLGTRKAWVQIPFLQLKERSFTFLSPVSSSEKRREYLFEKVVVGIRDDVA